MNFKVHVHICQQICCNKSWPRRERGSNDVQVLWFAVILHLWVHFFQLEIRSMSSPVAGEVFVLCGEAVPFDVLNDSTLNVLSGCVCVWLESWNCWNIVVHVEHFYTSWVINFEFFIFFKEIVLTSFGRPPKWIHQELSTFILSFVRKVQNPVK